MDTISITNFVNKGFGLAKQPSGCNTFIKYAIPGEKVEYYTDITKKTYSMGHAVKIINSHPQRITPPCQYYGSCGGCDLMHCSYPLQLELKKTILEDLLTREQGGVLSSVLSLLEDVLPAEKTNGYRQRIRLQVENGRLGFRKFQSHQIVPVNSCYIAHPLINSCLDKLLQSHDAAKLFQLSTEIELHLNPGTKKIVIILDFARKPRPMDRKNILSLIGSEPLVESIQVKGNLFAPLLFLSQDDASNKELHMAINSPMNSHKEVRLSWEIGGFCQVNLKQNQWLIDKAIELLGPKKDDSILDLYCGMGNFSIPLALLAGKVQGIEGQGSSIRSAKKNSIFNGLKNTCFEKQPIHRALETMAKQRLTFDKVIIDPPRSGVAGLVEQISQITHDRVLYISCDPSPLCRDLVDFIQHGFKISKILPVDMFPQTHHIETMVLLEKN